MVRQNQFASKLLRSIIITIGLFGIILSVIADSINLGRPGFGLWQISGVIVCFILIVVGILNVKFTIHKKLARVLFVIYMSGVLYMCLRPSVYEFSLNKTKALLNFDLFSWRDFTLNTIGFIPIGYLLMMSFGEWLKRQKSDLLKRALIAVGVGSLTSLFVEVCQYYLDFGRHSSLIDLTANIVGTSVGIVIYLFMAHDNTLSEKIHHARGVS